MVESETARAIELARDAIERLRTVERDGATPDRAQRASTLRESLAETLRLVERAMGRRRAAEHRLSEPDESELEVDALRAALVKAEDKERYAGLVLSVAVQRVSETLAGWKTP